MKTICNDAWLYVFLPASCGFCTCKHGMIFIHGEVARFYSDDRARADHYVSPNEGERFMNTVWWPDRHDADARDIYIEYCKEEEERCYALKAEMDRQAAEYAMSRIDAEVAFMVTI